MNDVADGSRLASVAGLNVRKQANGLRHALAALGGFRKEPAICDKLVGPHR